ncbi:TWiK family of potassium channels protein [Dirofilaria immitis]
MLYLDRIILMIRHLLRITNRHLNFEYFRRQSVHCLLLLFIIAYAFCGGLIFHKLESDASKFYRNEKITKTNLCVAQILRKMEKYSDEGVKHIENCWKDNIDALVEWNYVTSTLYGFGIMTTLGYNRIAPITTAGRMFSIIYGIFGIPITMIALSVTGRKLNAFVIKWKQKLANFQTRNLSREGSLKSIEDQKKTKKAEEISSGFATFVILITFLIYVVFGALLLPLLNGEIDFINGFYYNFLCLTAIDFGQLIPQRIALLPITFIYVCIGLALATIAIDDGSKYAKKLQHLGEKIKNVAATKIWFGGKTLKVGEVLHAVGEKCGVESSVIDNIDLDDLIEEVIAINEGRLPNACRDELPELEPLPKITIERSPTNESFKMNECFAAEDTISMTSSEVQNFDTHYNERVVVTQFFQCDETTEAVNFEQAKVMALVHEEMIKPSTYMVKVNIVIPAIDTSRNPKMLRKFEEKKKFYAGDPQNLFKVYEEEWKRVENLRMTRRRQPSDISQPSSSGQLHDGGQSRDSNQSLMSDQSRNNSSITQMSSKRLREREASTFQGSSYKKDSTENKQG